MPLELWVQAAHHKLKVRETPVPLVYLEEARSFGGALDDGRTRLEYYHLVLDRAMAAVKKPSGDVWSGTLCGQGAG
jgi:dolichol-phosphate mannosyltransferase